MDPLKEVKFADGVTIVFEPASPPTSLVASTISTGDTGGGDTTRSRGRSPPSESQGSADDCSVVNAAKEGTDEATGAASPPKNDGDTSSGLRPEVERNRALPPPGSHPPTAGHAVEANPPQSKETNIEASRTSLAPDNSAALPAPIQEPPSPSTRIASFPTESQQQIDRNVLAQASSVSTREGGGLASTHSLLAEYLLEGETIDQARQRLRTAIHQTKSLCKSFTDRVYSKYRVCLHPVQEYNDTIQLIQTDPRAYLERVATEMQLLKEEKDLEKKDANKLQAEQSALPGAAGSLDLTTAEQLLYVTAGLNLIILPEAELDPVSAARYPERGPFWRGERARGISQAAAIAGDVMLDRARKAAALRVERQKLLQRPIASAPPTHTSALDALQYAKTVAAAAIATTRANSSTDSTSASGAKPPPVFTSSGILGASKLPSGKGKSAGYRSFASRTQAQSALATASSLLSTTTLLSVSPLADQISNSQNARLAASTSALMARSCIQKTTQQRLKHPFPDSMGGRRRANSSRKDEFLQSHLALTLPPLPSTRERLERKAQPLCNAPTVRGVTAVRGILRLFQGKPVTKIGLMHGIRQLSEAALSRPIQDRSLDNTAVPDVSPLSTPPIDPGLAFSVLHTIGLVRGSDASSAAVRPSTSCEAFSSDVLNSPVLSDKLRVLRSSIGKSTLTERMLRLESDSSSCVVDTGDSPSICQDVQVESIRGGGDSSDCSSAGDVSENGDATPSKTPAVCDSAEKPKKVAGTDSTASIAGKRKYSDPTVAAGPQSRRKYSDPGTDEPSQSARLLSSQVAAVAQLSGAYGQTAALNAFHLASQLRSVQHPAGELADYVGNLHTRPSGFDLSSFFQATAPGSLPGLTLVQPTGGLLGFDSSRMFSRDQQAAAILSSSAFPQAASFTQAGSYPAAVNAILGSSPSMMNNHGSFSVAGSQMHVAQLSQPQSNIKSTSGTPQTGESYPANNISGTLLRSPAVVNSTAASSVQAHHSSPNGGDSNCSQSLPHTSADETDPQKTPTDEPPKRKQVQAEEATILTAPSVNNNAALPSTTSDLIQQGKFHLAVLNLPDSSKLLALDILGASAAVVPVPKALVSSPLKEKLANSGLKTGGGGAPNIPRDVIVSVILVWLWANHGKEFQEAFDKSGRYDVHHGCNWLIHTVVETAVIALSLNASESLVRSGKGQNVDPGASRKLGTKIPTVQSNERDASAAKLQELSVASVVSKAICAEVQIDATMDRAVAQFQGLVDYLDEVRLCALRAKAQERTMLASLISRTAMMSEPFANAYVSSVVRAGEALGHENLFEAVQDIESNTSSLMPYDILTAEGELWEEPCKPERSFTAGMTGEDMMRRAHARASLQKSLRKLQERNQIRGGIHNHGPFAEHLGRSPSAVASAQPAASPRVGHKRKAAFGEILPSGGTGSARAKTWSVYEPVHFSAPLDWQPDHSENMPYGLHRVGERVRSLSLSLSARSGEPRNIKKAKRSSSFSGAAVLVETVKPEDGLPKSTQEINWGDIAGIFQSVELPKKAPPAKAGDKGQHGESVKSSGEVGTSKTIYAPYCGVIDLDTLQDDETLSEVEDDLNDETILARHQVVLDAMKARHAAFLDARRKYQEERRKSRSNK